jgi:hypothetical protein
VGAHLVDVRAQRMAARALQLRAEVLDGVQVAEVHAPAVGQRGIRAVLLQSSIRVVNRSACERSIRV